MQRLFFTVLIFSNMLFIQGQFDEEDFPFKPEKGETDISHFPFKPEKGETDLSHFPFKNEKDYDSFSNLYAQYRTGKSPCKTQGCQLNEVINKFFAESERVANNPPISAPNRPSIFGGFVHWLLQQKKKYINNRK